MKTKMASRVGERTPVVKPLKNISVVRIPNVPSEL